MIQIVIPMFGKSVHFDREDHPFPKPFIEINRKIMIQHVIDNFQSIKEEKQFIFLTNENDCEKYGLDNVLRMITPDPCKVIKLKHETKGAACTVLFSIDEIDHNEPMIISNADQLITVNFQEVIEKFKVAKSDAGVISFDSVHPKWSYVITDDDNQVIRAAEKLPISKTAIAGWYYFSKAKNFIDAAMESIAKEATVNGLYFIAPTYNELVLQNKKINTFHIPSQDYHSFYSPEKINEYEKNIVSE